MAAASAALAEARARGPPMSPDHPPEAEEDDDCLLTPTAGRTAALLDPPMPSSSTTTTAPSLGGLQPLTKESNKHHQRVL